MRGFRESLRNLHYRLAFGSGWLEHRFSRLVFVCILIVDGYYVWKIFPEHVALGYVLWVETCLWLLYWMSHRIEKREHSAARRG
ncbi:hypothetical protein MUP01_11980 [Candidatus Bathyarchaeota archaeon]|nr:hypothetical protein [Candidatus Bathyarchaeota archaeon]